MKSLSWLIVPVALLGLAAVVHSQNPTPAGRSIAVEGALVTLIEDSKVPATQVGMLTAIHVKEGDFVEADERLADIDNRETLAKQKVAQAELNAAKAHANSTAELEVAKAAVLVATAELEAAEEIRRRTPGAVSEAEMRKLRFQLERAQAQVRLAMDEKEKAKESVHSSEAQLLATEFELDMRTVKAAYRGEVVEIFKKRGEWVQPGEPILHLVGLDRVRIEGFVRSSLAAPGDVLGKPVVISIYSAGNREPVTVRSTIGHASPVIDASQSFRIWADVENQRVTDPITRLETWAIQPGSEATMTIDLAARPTGAAPARPNLTPTSAPGGTPPIRPAGEGPQFRLPTPAAPATPGRAFSFKPVLTGPGDDATTNDDDSANNKPEPIRAAPTSKSRER